MPTGAESRCNNPNADGHKDMEDDGVEDEAKVWTLLYDRFHNVEMLMNFLAQLAHLQLEDSEHCDSFSIRGQE